MAQRNKATETKTNLPSHHVFHVSEGKNGFWTKIGAAWYHKDREGLTIDLDMVPVRNGRIVLRRYDAKAARPEQDTGEAA